MTRSARGCIRFVEVWASGSVILGNVSDESLIFLSMFLVLVCDILNGFSLGSVIL